MLRVAAAVIMSTRPRAMLLAMTTMRKSTHEFPFLSYMSMGLCSSAIKSPEHKKLQLSLLNLLNMRNLKSKKQGT